MKLSITMVSVRLRKFNSCQVLRVCLLISMATIESVHAFLTSSHRHIQFTSFLQRPSLRLLVPETSSANTDKDSCNTINENEEPWRARKRRRISASSEIDKHYVHRSTKELLEAQPGSLTKGKWHQLTSMITAWSGFCKTDPQAPVLMESLLKRLLEEQAAGNKQCLVDVTHYNQILDGWACAALFQTQTDISGAERACQILMLLQQRYEESGDERIRPNAESFDLVLHVTCRTRGAVPARRLLALMEYLSKTGRNEEAKPTFSDYIMVLDTYASLGTTNAGTLAEGFIRHMMVNGISPTTLCYNIAIKAWTKGQRGRSQAEHADRILETMEAKPDVITYASVVSAWASSGMKLFAVNRAEELVRDLENKGDLEPNRLVLNALMSTWVKSKNPAAVERTREILNAMRASENVQPDLFSYNTYIHALCSHSNVKGNAERASTFLKEWERAYDTGNFQTLPRPNRFSYNLVIWGLCKSISLPGKSKPQKRPGGATQEAASILRKLIGRDGVDPDSFSFNQILVALGKQGDAQNARGLLDYMESSFSSGLYPDAKPDIVSYGSTMQAYARSGTNGAAEAEALLQICKERYKSGDRDFKPDSTCYNSVINCWAKSGEGTLAARKAEALLEELLELQSNDPSMRADVLSYNGVVNAWARSGTRCCGLKAETYLNKMWKLYDAGNTKLQPDDFTYNTVSNLLVPTFSHCSHSNSFRSSTQYLRANTSIKRKRH